MKQTPSKDSHLRANPVYVFAVVAFASLTLLAALLYPRQSESLAETSFSLRGVPQGDEQAGKRQQQIQAELTEHKFLTATLQRIPAEALSAAGLADASTDEIVDWIRPKIHVRVMPDESGTNEQVSVRYASISKPFAVHLVQALAEQYAAKQRNPKPESVAPEALEREVAEIERQIQRRLARQQQLQSHANRIPQDTASADAGADIEAAQDATGDADRFLQVVEAPKRDLRSSQPFSSALSLQPARPIVTDAKSEERLVIRSKPTSNSSNLKPSGSTERPRHPTASALVPPASALTQHPDNVPPELDALLQDARAVVERESALDTPSLSASNAATGASAQEAKLANLPIVDYIEASPKSPSFSPSPMSESIVGHNRQDHDDLIRSRIGQAESSPLHDTGKSSMPVVYEPNPRWTALRGALDKARRQLDALLGQLTPEHPEVDAISHRILRLEEQLKRTPRTRKVQPISAQPKSAQPTSAQPTFTPVPPLPDEGSDREFRPLLNPPKRQSVSVDADPRANGDTDGFRSLGDFRSSSDFATEIPNRVSTGDPTRDWTDDFRPPAKDPNRLDVAPAVDGRAAAAQESRGGGPMTLPVRSRLAELPPSEGADPTAVNSDTLEAIDREIDALRRQLAEARDRQAQPPNDAKSVSVQLSDSMPVTRWLYEPMRAFDLATLLLLPVGLGFWLAAQNAPAKIPSVLYSIEDVKKSLGTRVAGVVSPSHCRKIPQPIRGGSPRWVRTAVVLCEAICVLTVLWLLVCLVTLPDFLVQLCSNPLVALGNSVDAAAQLLRIQ